MDDAPSKADGQLPTGFRVSFYRANGQQTLQLAVVHSTGPVGSPVPAGPPLPRTLADLHLREGVPTTLPAGSGGGQWRVLYSRTAVDGVSYVAALPLDTVDGATSRLLRLDGAVLLAAVLALLAAGRWVVRMGLLPLTRVERTARGIASGDLDLRLPDPDPRTGIGRLGLVFNIMLDRLQQALGERADSEARLRRFVADSGHELRTPLTAVQGFTELMLRHDGLPAEERREAHRLVAQHAERMALLVEDLLLLARLDEEPAYLRERVDLLAAAADAAVTAAAAGRPIDLSALGAGPDGTGPNRSRPDGTEPDGVGREDDGAGSLPVVEVLGDRHRVRQILGNLLGGALLHTPPGTPVHVRLGTVVTGPATGGTDRPGRSSAAPPMPRGSRVGVVEVADEGPGLSAEQAERVFECFHRVDPSRSRRHGGSGPGLAIASAIARSHGGRLEVDTVPGRGCTFRLLLPLPPQPAQPQPP